MPVFVYLFNSKYDRLRKAQAWIINGPTTARLHFPAIVQNSEATDHDVAVFIRHLVACS